MFSPPVAFTANLQVQLIGMESCSGRHFLGRALRDQGHQVRLMPAQYVKPYVQINRSAVFFWNVASRYPKADVMWRRLCRGSWKMLSCRCQIHFDYCWHS